MRAMQLLGVRLSTRGDRRDGCRRPPAGPGALHSSAAVAGWESINRLIDPRPIANPWLLVAAGLIGFADNELVAIYRIRVGRRIGSAALVADGVHARLDGFTSLSVVLGAIGVLAGFPLADPIIGLLIAASIMVLPCGTVKSIGRRLMDGIDPDLHKRAEHALEHALGVRGVHDLYLRWIGHRLTGSATIEVDAEDLLTASQTADQAEAHLRAALGNLDAFTVTPIPPVPAQRLSSAVRGTIPPGGIFFSILILEERP